MRNMGERVIIIHMELIVKPQHTKSQQNYIQTGNIVYPDGPFYTISIVTSYGRHVVSNYCKSILHACQ